LSAEGYTAACGIRIQGESPGYSRVEFYVAAGAVNDGIRCQDNVILNIHRAANGIDPAAKADYVGIIGRERYAGSFDCPGNNNIPCAGSSGFVSRQIYRASCLDRTADGDIVGYSGIHCYPAAGFKIAVKADRSRGVNIQRGDIGVSQGYCSSGGDREIICAGQGAEGYAAGACGSIYIDRISQRREAHAGSIDGFSRDITAKNQLLRADRYIFKPECSPKCPGINSALAGSQA